MRMALRIGTKCQARAAPRDLSNDCDGPFGKLASGLGVYYLQELMCTVRMHGAGVALHVIQLHTSDSASRMRLQCICNACPRPRLIHGPKIKFRSSGARGGAKERNTKGTKCGMSSSHPFPCSHFASGPHRT